MAQYRITSPDGAEFVVTAPEGATQDQVLEYAKSQWQKKASAAPAAPKREVEDPGALQTALIGAGRTVDRIGKGMQQLYYGLTGNQEAQAKLKADAAADDQAYKGLKELRPWATGIGEALPSMAVPVGAGATLAGNAGRMALAGGVPAALEYGTAGERLKSGAQSAAAGAAFPLVGAAMQTGKALFEPLYDRGREQIISRLLNRVSGSEAKAVTQRLVNATELVPGSAPTAAQVAESGGIAALERSAAAANPEPYTQRAMSQAAARLSALRSVAGDDAAMAAAQSAREAAKDALYAQADNGVAPVDNYFRGLMKRDLFSGAVSRAQALANGNGLDDIFFRDNKGNPVALLGHGAHFIKKALDEAADPTSSTFTSKVNATNASETNKLFQNWLDKSIPEYRLGKEAFAEKSVPINQMQIGRELLDRVSPALADYGALGRETGERYARALRDGDAVAQKATGFSGSTMKDVLSPEQFSLVENVAKDLARKANAQDLGRGIGSDTFQKLSMQNIAEQSGMPGLVSGLLNLPVARNATSWIYRENDDALRGLLADTLLNPQRTGLLMQKTQPKLLGDSPRARKAMEQALLRGSGLLGLSSLEALNQD